MCAADKKFTGTPGMEPCDCSAASTFLQNTTRGIIRNNTLPSAVEGAGGATAGLIDGVKYTTAGVTALAGFQQLGYACVQP